MYNHAERLNSSFTEIESSQLAFKQMENEANSKEHLAKEKARTNDIGHNL